MTYRRLWTDEYLSDIAAIPDEDLRVKVRSMTTILAGNPYLEMSWPVQENVRSINVSGRLSLTYRVGNDPTLVFLSVKPCEPHGTDQRRSRVVTEEIRP